MKHSQASLHTRNTWTRPWLLVSFLCALLFAQVAWAAQDSYTRITAVKLEPNRSTANPGWNLAAEFDIKLGPRLLDAVNRGLPLQFAVDFKLLRERWYWMDQEAVSTTYTYNLSYNALTRTYRLVTPTGTFNAPRLEDAMENMAKVSDWPVIQKNQVVLGEPYKAQIRFRLVLTELPKPFQISALVNSEWDLYSDWLIFDFIPRREGLK